MAVVTLAPYLVNAIVSVSLLRAVFAVLSTLAAAHNSNRFTLLPIFGLGSVFVIDRDVAVESQRPEGKCTVNKGKTPCSTGQLGNLLG